LDGRYYTKVRQLEPYFSEYALIRYRLFVELEWFIFICNEVKLPGTRVLKKSELQTIRELSTLFEPADAQRVKDIEATTNHDVKAVEYFIKEHFRAYPELDKLAEFVHFGCTSEDINNVAYNLMVKDFGAKEYLPLLAGLIYELHGMALKNKKVPMMSRTHGQSASPTTLGKELINVVARLEGQLKLLNQIPYTGKWSGAVGNFNAHLAAYRTLDWAGISVRFLSYLGLTPNPYTTQIEPHDNFAAIFDNVARINTILIDFSRDMWSYISHGYFKQTLKKGEVGSSTMPHKINPIDYENAEGNLGVANALLRHLAEKLPISRMQRDLSDSTVLRTIGTAAGHTVLSYKSLMNGLKKVEVNQAVLEDDLDSNWEVLTEAVQTILRRQKVSGAYEQLKELSRGKRLTSKALASFIKQLKLPASDKKYLLNLTPATYTGLAAKLVESYKLTI
ncbi:adenylosuccinate lyase, partial [Candidatus Peregrinibacteria bacterium CG_4_9_14_0_2_um_filter_53_11]